MCCNQVICSAYLRIISNRCEEWFPIEHYIEHLVPENCEPLNCKYMLVSYGPNIQLIAHLFVIWSPVGVLECLEVAIADANNRPVS